MNPEPPVSRFRIPLFLASFTPADLRRLGPWAVLAGLLGGGCAAAFMAALHLAEKILAPEHHSPWVHVGVMAGAGLGVALLSWWFGAPGNVELLVDNIHTMGGRVRRGEWKSLLPMALLCVASGGALGPEAPLVQTTGTLGTALARRLHLSKHDRRILTITGMAAGFTALFGAPLGGAVFALEILHRRGMEYYEALLPALIGSLCGYLVYALATGVGLEPAWHFPPVDALTPMDFLLAAGAGVAGAALAFGFEHLVKLLQAAFAKIPAFIRPILGGALLGLLGVITPFALTFGEEQIGEVVAAHPLVSAMLLAAAAKFVASALSVACGWRGGFIIPLFFMGSALAMALHAAFPDIHATVLVAAMMAAASTGVTKTPLGSTLVVARMGGITLLPTTLLAALVSLLLSSGSALIHSQRERVERRRPGAGSTSVAA